MSSLSNAEKRSFENLLGMSGGYVLDFSNSKFADFFYSFDVDIYHDRYSGGGGSKANRLRTFWNIETNDLVAKALSDLIDISVITTEEGGEFLGVERVEIARNAITKLLNDSNLKSEQISFVTRSIYVPDLSSLPIEDEFISIIQSRLQEAELMFDAGGYLSVIFLSGSILEAILLGSAKSDPEAFNRSSTSPKDHDGIVKTFSKWTLAQLIDTAYDVKIIKLDVKKHSHELRDFRNYIHPNEQLISGFSPDEHTAMISLQVMRAALASIAGRR